MKSSRVILFLLFAAASICTYAQDVYPKNALSINLGSGTVASLDYERFWQNKNNQNFLSMTLGLGAGKKIEFAIFDESSTFDKLGLSLIFPQRVTYNLGNGKNYLELGLGRMLVFRETANTNIAYTTIGYRFKGEDKSSFKFYVTLPFAGIDSANLIFFPIGLSLGKYF